MTAPIHILACLLLCAGLSGCGLPDRWNASFAHEASAGNLPARDIISGGVSGPLGFHPNLTATPP